jgi:restriction endonuclease S subunit
MPNLNQTILNNLELSVPSLSEQQRIVSEIKAYEQKISEAKAIMGGCAERKKNILEKYLKLLVSDKNRQP